MGKQKPDRCVAKADSGVAYEQRDAYHNPWCCEGRKEESLQGVAAREAATPIDDMRGTVEFRTPISGVLTDRVIREAVARARGEETGYRIGQ